MLIPKYWAQYKQRFDSKIASSSTTLKQATIKRYGWSDVSQEQALLHAKQRVADAQNRWLAGEDIVCRERKEQYNQENGIPIREQIIAEHDFSTINSSTSSFIDNNLIPDLVGCGITVSVGDIIYTVSGSTIVVYYNPAYNPTNNNFVFGDVANALCEKQSPSIPTALPGCGG